jgi:4-carboxymuconolactone decarboxylase
MKLFAAVLAALAVMVSSARAQEATPMASPTRLSREDIQAVAPALDKYTQERLRGEVRKRPGLDARDRSIITVAALHLCFWLISLSAF